MQPPSTVENVSVTNGNSKNAAPSSKGAGSRSAASSAEGGISHLQTHLELIGMLNEVADAVSSAMRVDEVLNVIIERVKRITNTDKAVLVLTYEQDEGIDMGSIVVRGRRDQHVQEWWESCIQEISRRGFDAVGGTAPIIEDHAEQNAVLACSPILLKNRPIGFIVAINELERPFDSAQIDFLAVVAAFASSVIENAKLTEQNRLVLVASERDRIARTMHDGVVQSLFSISLGLEVCKKNAEQDPAACAQRLDELQEHLQLAMTELRRVIYNLRPIQLTELGLANAIQYWLQEVTIGRPVVGRLAIDGTQQALTPAVESCLYCITKEAVSNAIKHAEASEVEVCLGFSSDAVHLEVRDNGKGFDVSQAYRGDIEQIGLRSIRQRAEHEGGAFVVKSVPGEGTSVIVDLKLGVRGE